MSRSDKISGELIILGTPIGNLNDFSKRGIETLKNSDFIAAEDTRVTRKLLYHFGIQKSIISYFEYTSTKKTEIIVKRILNGENCTLVSDAGMPTISDPGQKLINKCLEKEIKIKVVPGPTAFSCAIAVSGFFCRRFTFEGFLNANKRLRENHLKELVNEKRTMIFYEAPHKLVKTLSYFLNFFGNRRISISREITKIYEENKRTTIKKALEHYSKNIPKGEFVLVIEGKKEIETKEFTITDSVEIAKEFLLKGLNINEASKNAAHQTGFKKSEIYKELLRELELNKNLFL